SDVQPITFSTHLVPMTRGIMTTIYANAVKETNLDELYELFSERYQDAYFVRVGIKDCFQVQKKYSDRTFATLVSPMMNGRNALPSFLSLITLLRELLVKPYKI